MPDSRKKADTQPQTFSTAAVLINEVPHYELTAESIAYPLEGYTGTVRWRAYFHLKPIPEREFIKTFDHLSDALEFKAEQRDVLSLDSGNRSAVRDVVMGHFVRIEGLAKDAPVEKQKQWLQANANIQSRIWTEGVNGVGVDEEQMSEGELDILSGKSSNEIALFHKLYCPETGLVERISLRYALRDETVADRNQFDSVTKSLVDLRRDVRKIRENYNVISTLFGSILTGASGLLFEGKPLDASNDVAFRKALKLIPFPHKYLVVKTAFDEQRAKNV